MLATVHNLHWYARFMESMRESIIEGTFSAFRAEVHENYAVDPRPAPVAADPSQRSRGLRREGGRARSRGPRKGPKRNR